MKRVTPSGRQIAVKSYSTPVVGCSRGESIRTACTTLLADDAVTGMEDWTHDGRFVIFGLGPKNISALQLGGGRKPVPVVESSSPVDEPHVSRDGRWLAYSGFDTGQWEVYVQPFLRPGRRVRVSTNGGSQPRWRGDGGELFYLALDGTLMSVRTTDPASPGAPRQLFQLRRRMAVVPPCALVRSPTSTWHLCRLDKPRTRSTSYSRVVGRIAPVLNCASELGC